MPKPDILCSNASWITVESDPTALVYSQMVDVELRD